jgi:hypothetical protein
MIRIFQARARVISMTVTELTVARRTQAGCSWSLYRRPIGTIGLRPVRGSSSLLFLFTPSSSVITITRPCAMRCAQDFRIY